MLISVKPIRKFNLILIIKQPGRDFMIGNIKLMNKYIPELKIDQLYVRYSLLYLQKCTSW